MWLRSSIYEMDLEVLVNKLNMSQQCTVVTTKGNWVDGCIHRSITSRERDVTIPLYLTLVRAHLHYCVLVPTIKKKQVDCDV